MGWRFPARIVNRHGDRGALGRNAAPYTYAPDSGCTYDVRLQVMQLEKIALAGVSGELYSSIGTLMQKVSPAEKTILITHTMGPDGGVFSGYISDDEGCTMGGNGGLGYAEAGFFRDMCPLKCAV